MQIAYFLRMRHIVTCGPLRLYEIFPHYLISDTIFGGNYIYIYIYIKVKVSHNRSRWHKGFRVGYKAPDSLDVRHYEGGRSSVLSTGRLYPRINPWYSFLEAESTPGHMDLSGATEKISSDTTGNRSRDRQTSSAVP